MRKFVIFDKIRTDTDLDLYLASVSIGSPAVRTSFVDVPGLDGPLDLTEALGEIHYGARTLSFSLGRRMYDRYEQDATIKNALHGRRMKIRLSDDLDHYYLGRVSVGEWVRDCGLGRVTITATCDPWRYNAALTEHQLGFGPTGTKRVELTNQLRPAVPTITTPVALTLAYNGSTFAVDPGTHRILDICLPAGTSYLDITVPETPTLDPNIVTISYQEAGL